MSRSLEDRHVSIRRLADWAWLVAMLVACLLPKHLLPLHEHGAGASPTPHLDKVVHFLMFLGFGLLWGGARPVTALVLGLIVAVATELAQGLPLVHRDPDLFDGLADVAGVLVGVAIIRLRTSGRDPASGPEDEAVDDPAVASIEGR